MDLSPDSPVSTPSPSSSHTDELNQDLPPGFLYLSEEENRDGEEEERHNSEECTEGYRDEWVDDKEELLCGSDPEVELDVLQRRPGLSEESGGEEVEGLQGKRSRPEGESEGEERENKNGPETEGERDGGEDERPEKRPRMGRESEGAEKTELRLQKAVQQLVEERLRVLKLSVFDRSLQELQARVGRMESKHQRDLHTLQEKITRLSMKCVPVAARQTTESADKQPEANSEPLRPQSSTSLTSTPAEATLQIQRHGSAPALKNAGVPAVAPTLAPAPTFAIVSTLQLLPDGTSIIRSSPLPTVSAPTATPPPPTLPRLAVPPSPGAPVASSTQPSVSSQPPSPTTHTATPPASHAHRPASMPTLVQPEVSGVPSPSRATNASQPFGRPSAPVSAPARPSQTGSPAIQSCVRPVVPLPAPVIPSKQANQATQTHVRSNFPLNTGGEVTKRPADSTVSKTTLQMLDSWSRAEEVVDLTTEDEDDHDEDVLGSVSLSPAMNTVPGGPLQSLASKLPASTSASSSSSSTSTTTLLKVFSLNPGPKPPGLPAPPAAPRPPSGLTAALAAQPQKPRLSLAPLRAQNGVVLSWSVESEEEEAAAADRSRVAIDCYQLYSYHRDPSAPARHAPPPDSSPSASSRWTRIGEMRAAQQQPMTCTLTNFPAGSSYYFAVRARDALGRYGPFCEPQRYDAVVSSGS